MHPTPAHRWKPVIELPPDLQRHRSPSLVGLAQAWREEREAMRELQVEPVFLDRWKNRLAVETGIIEGLYSLSRGITETLIERGFDATLLPSSETDGGPQAVTNLLLDQRQAIDLVFDVVSQRRGLTVSFIKELHALLTRHQATTTAVDQFGRPMQLALLHGEFKQRPNNPTRTLMRWSALTPVT